MPESGPPQAPPLRGIDDAFRSIVEQAQDYAIFLLDRDGHIASWNAGARHIKGYEAHEIVGRHFSVFYPPEAIERRWPQHELEVAAREGRFEDEGWRVRRDGSLFWANVVITALRDDAGVVRGFGKITRDLTERRRNEQMVRESEERFRLLIESVRDYAIFMLDTQGRVASWNAGAERIKGYRAEEIIGEHFRAFYNDDARQRQWPDEELRRAREDGRYEEEGIRVRKDGTTFWASVVISPMRDHAGVLRGYAKVTRDLTDRKRIESMESSERHMQEFLAVLAHELRNPLAPISNALNLLARKPTSDPSEIWVRDVLQRQAGQLTRLVDDLLDVSRITRAALVLDRKAVDLRTLVRQAADASMQWFEQKRHTLDITVPDERLGVEGDEVRLLQVVQNLLHNAAKYTPEGGRIELRVTGEGDEAAIRVRDNGIGMRPETLSTAFELFKQADQGLDRSQGGLGVGLTLVQRLVKMHGGSIQALSEGLGQGSEFVVRLPLFAGDTVENAEPADAGPVAANGPAPVCRVLVVDDNTD